MVTNPYDPPGEVSRPESSAPLIEKSSSWWALGRWRWVPVVWFNFYLLWQFMSMTENTSFEHHPLAGGLILIHTSQTISELMIGAAICGGLVAGMGAYLLRPTLPFIVASGLALGGWFWLSFTLARWASC